MFYLKILFVRHLCEDDSSSSSNSYQNIFIDRYKKANGAKVLFPVETFLSLITFFCKGEEKLFLIFLIKVAGQFSLIVCVVIGFDDAKILFNKLR